MKKILKSLLMLMMGVFAMTTVALATDYYDWSDATNVGTTKVKTLSGHSAMTTGSWLVTAGTPTSATNAIECQPGTAASSVNFNGTSKTVTYWLNKCDSITVYTKGNATRNFRVEIEGGNTLNTLTTGSCKSITYKVAQPGNTKLTVSGPDGSVYVPGIVFYYTPSGAAGVVPSPTRFDLYTNIKLTDTIALINLKGTGLTGEPTVELKVGAAGTFSLPNVVGATQAALSNVAGFDLQVQFARATATNGIYKDTILIYGGGLTATVKVPLYVEVDNSAPVLKRKQPEGTNAPIKLAKLVFNKKVKIVDRAKILVNSAVISSGSYPAIFSDTVVQLFKPSALTTYTVEVQNGAIVDVYGNAYAGTTWSFTTGSDSIIFPYTPVVDEDFVNPSWMTNAGLELRSSDWCMSPQKYALRTSSSASAVFKLPKCGEFKVDLSTNGSNRAYRLLVNGAEVTAQTSLTTNAVCGGANYVSYSVNSFDSVTVTIEDKGSTSGISLYNLNITAPASIPSMASKAPQGSLVSTATTAVTVTYDMDIELGSAVANISVNAGATKVSGTPSASGRVLTIPVSSLIGNTTYTVTVPIAGVQSAETNSPTTVATTWTFTTAPTGVVEKPIIIENFQDWNNTKANTDTTVTISLKLKSGATIAAGLTNCMVLNSGTTKSSPATANVSTGYVQLGKEEGIYTVGTMVLPTIPNNIIVTKVWFTASATGTSPDTAIRGIYLYKKGADDADWVRVGGAHAALQNGSVFTEEINEANVQLKLTSQNDLKVKQLVNLHDLKVYGMINPDSSSIPADPTGVSVTASTDTIFIGGSLQLTAVVTPSNASQEVIWSTTSGRISVSATGLVTTKAGATAGTADVQVKVKADETITATKTLRVVVQTTGARKLSQASASVKPNPVDATLYVTSGEGEELEKVVIISTTGVQLRTTTSAEVDMQGLASGNYFALVYNKGKKLPAVVSIVKE